MDPDSRLALIIHTAERDERLRSVFEELARLSVWTLQRELNERGIPTPCGAPRWSYSTVERTRWRMRHRYGWPVGACPRLDAMPWLTERARKDRLELEEARRRAT